MAKARMMRQKEQRHLQFRISDLMRYAPETGLFIWLVSRGAVKAGDVAGCTHKRSGYIYITIDGKQYLAARLAYLFMTGRFPQPTIDHINQNRADNRWENLQQATFQEQRINQGDPAKNDTVSTEACCNKQNSEWKPTIKVDDKVNHFEQFDDIEDFCLANIYAELAIGRQSGAYNGGGVA